MSLDTLLEAAKYVEWKSHTVKPTRDPVKDSHSYSKPAPSQGSADDSSGEGGTDRGNSLSENEYDLKSRPGGSGTREVHNKLEKNRRAHLKECFELLKSQIPSIEDLKKTSNLSILRGALKYIQVLKRREREYEVETQRLASEKIKNQYKLDVLKNELQAMNVRFDLSVWAVADDQMSNSTNTATERGTPINSDDEDMFDGPQSQAPSIPTTTTQSYVMVHPNKIQNAQPLSGLRAQLAQPARIIVPPSSSIPLATSHNSGSSHAYGRPPTVATILSQAAQRSSSLTVVPMSKSTTHVLQKSASVTQMRTPVTQILQQTIAQKAVARQQAIVHQNILQRSHSVPGTLQATSGITLTPLTNVAKTPVPVSTPASTGNRPVIHRIAIPNLVSGGTMTGGAIVANVTSAQGTLISQNAPVLTPVTTGQLNVDNKGIYTLTPNPQPNQITISRFPNMTQTITASPAKASLSKSTTTATMTTLRPVVTLQPTPSGTQSDVTTLRPVVSLQPAPVVTSQSNNNNTTGAQLMKHITVPLNQVLSGGQILSPGLNLSQLMGQTLQAAAPQTSQTSPRTPVTISAIPSFTLTPSGAPSPTMAPTRPLVPAQLIQMPGTQLVVTPSTVARTTTTPTRPAVPTQLLQMPGTQLVVTPTPSTVARSSATPTTRQTVPTQLLQMPGTQLVSPLTVVGQGGVNLNNIISPQMIKQMGQNPIFFMQPQMVPEQHVIMVSVPSIVSTTTVSGIMTNAVAVTTSTSGKS
ncbi:unnamed protein product [Owenia fusiformis]|uniref:Max-binding protein MNT n=1 Tax=Owenia fusiformis TaxID=6347 RepID=A0A8J1UT78_OWEFU|nr:unnamed protein product [Owenia fusiformis]